MKTIPPAAKRLLDRLDRRLKKSRPASVLILVVALLVLLALIGTAFITTTGTDRYSAAQHAVNTEIDMLAEGVVDMCEGAILKDLLAGQQYRSSTNGHEPVDHSERDRWLAARVPGEPGHTGTAALWPYTSGSPIESGPATALPPEFEMPWTGQGPNSEVPHGKRPEKPYHNSRQAMAPTYVGVPQPDGSVKRFPALVCGDPADPTHAGETYLAADTDGDGIADASLFRLGTGQVNGVTYYAAVRIIDNASAINASIATKMNTEPVETGNAELLRGDFFPTNIDLLNLLVASQVGQGVQYPPPQNGPQYQQLQRLYNFRYTGNPNVQPQVAFTQARRPVYSEAAGNRRMDFDFFSPYEELWFKLGSRLANPGTQVDGTTLFKALNISEQQHLANGFTVQLGGSSSSVLRDAIGPSLGARTTPYWPDEVGAWMAQNFRYEVPGGGPLLQMPVQPLLVTRNPTGNWVPDVLMEYSANNRPTKFRYRGPWMPGQFYEMGDWVTRTVGTPAQTGVTMPRTQPPGSPTPWLGELQAFVCTRDNPTTADQTPIDPTAPSGAWAWMPWATDPTKVNLNTATFGQLFAGFYAVMKDAPLVYPKQPQLNSPKPPSDPGGPFRNVLFRSPPPGGEALNGWQMGQIRAALAAVNAIDMRDFDNEVTSRSLTLLDRPNGTPQFYVDVYGSEPQPFITEVLVHTYSDQRSYIAIELFNPFPVNISLRGWKLAVLHRVDIATTGLWARELEDLATIGIDTIPAGQRLLITSRDHRPGDLDYVELSTPPAAPRPQPPPPKEPAPFKSDKLGELIQTGASEMVLMRPRRPVPTGGPINASLSRSNHPENTFDEKTTGTELVDYVPVDQLDFSGIPAVWADPNTFQPADRRYHYARANDPSLAWHWVYPGEYNPDGVGDREGVVGLRHDGWRVDPGRVNTGGPYDPATGYYPGGFWQFKQAFAPSTNPGAPPQQPGHATYVTQPVFLAAPGTPGPFPFGTAGGNRFPFGGFARVGDVMHVPFIGGYRVQTVANRTATPPRFSELHAVTMDSIRADDANNGDAIKPPVEQIGRFVPIDTLGDLLVAPQTPNKPRYSWASDLFDVFTVLSPQDDFLPNVDPHFFGDPTVTWNGTPETPPKSSAKWPVRPEEIPNLANTQWHQANWGREDAAAIEGRINVNTAHWRVLAAVPMVPFKNQSNWLQLNVALAKAIVHFRDVNNGTGNPHGPFRNLWELNRVFDVANNNQSLNFQNGWGQLDPNGDIDDDEGDISPVGVGAKDLVPGGFESRYAMINRVSNLLTTQSDSFTVYVTVQGWRNAGSDTPELVALRRTAAIIDRSGVYPRRVGLMPPGSIPPDLSLPVKTTPMDVTPIPLQQ